MLWIEVPAYIFAQAIGAFAGVAIAHVMFELPVFSLSHHVRWAECNCSASLLLHLVCSLSYGAAAAPAAQAVSFAVGAYITGAYWFTASTSFANPVVTLARSFTDTFSGIRFADAPGFIAAQLTGALAATVVWSWLWGRRSSHGQ